MKPYLAELIGTAILVIIGCGAIIFAGASISVLGIALAFGLGLTVVTYLVGHVSGAHVNPAVTIALALSRKFPWSKVLGYIIAQLIGAIIGAAILYAVIANLTFGGRILALGFGTTAIHTGVSVMAAGLIEVILTMILCLVYLATTRSSWPSTATPIAVGITFFAGILVALPLTGGSLNPARSIGPALVSGQNLQSLALFIIAPIIGGVVAYFIHCFVLSNRYRDRE